MVSLGTQTLNQEFFKEGRVFEEQQHVCDPPLFQSFLQHVENSLSYLVCLIIAVLYATTPSDPRQSTSQYGRQGVVGRGREVLLGHHHEEFPQAARPEPDSPGRMAVE